MIDFIYFYQYIYFYYNNKIFLIKSLKLNIYHKKIK